MNAPVTNVETCPVCGDRIDPESYAIHAETRERYCSGRCWSEGVFGDV